MAVDLATLSLRLETSQALSDAQLLAARLEAMGEKGETAAKKIAASSNPVTAALKQQAIDYTQLTARASDFARAGASAAQVSQMAGVSMAQAAAAVKTYSGTVSKAEIDVGGLKAAQAQLALANMSVGESAAVASAGFSLTGANLGRLRMGLTSAIASMSGVSPIVARIASTLAVMGVGMVEVVAGLVAVAALVWVWDKMTEGSRKAMEAADKLAESYNEIARIQLFGSKEAADLDTLNKGLQEHVKWLRNIIDLRVSLHAAGLGAIAALIPGGGHADAGGAIGTASAVAEQQRVNELGLQNAKDNQAFADRVKKEAADADAAMQKRIEILTKGIIFDDQRKQITAQLVVIEHQLETQVNSGTLSIEKRIIALGRLGVVMDALAQKFSTPSTTGNTDILSLIGITGNGETAGGRALDAYGGPMALVKAQAHNLIDALQKEGTAALNDAMAREKKMLNEIQRDFATFFANIFSEGIKSFGDLFSSIKDMFLKLLADMLAERMMAKLAGVIGAMMGVFGTPAAAGAQAAGQAATTGAAGFINRHGGAIEGAGIGLAGFGVGYGLGGAVGNAPGGALVGAAGGAAAGAAIGSLGGPIGVVTGALIGGAAGLVGGLLGGASAAREAANAMKQLQKDYTAAVATFKHDDLAKQLADNAAAAETLRQMAEKLFGTVWDLIKDGGAGLQQQYAVIAAQEAKNAAMIQRQAQYAQEDLAVRNLRATGQGSQADLVAFQEQQQRERQAAIDSNRDALYINTLKTVQNNELIAFQNGLLQSATRNAPTGFYGIEAYLGQFATPGGSPAGYPTDGGTPGNPYQPQHGGGGPSGTTNNNPAPPRGPVTNNYNIDRIVVDGSKSAQEIASALVRELDKTAAATGGTGSSRAAALETMR